MDFSCLTNNEVAVYYTKTHEMGAKEEVMRRYENLVQDIVRQYRYRPDYEDLEQEGRCAMIQALENYQPGKFEFSTIAVHYISGKVRHFIRDKGSLVRVPAWVQDHYRREMQVSAEFTSVHGRPPSDKELADRMGLSLAKLQQIHANNPQQIKHTDLSVYTTGRENEKGKNAVAMVPEAMMANIFGDSETLGDGLFDHDELLSIQNATVHELMHDHHLTMLDARKLKAFAER